VRFGGATAPEQKIKHSDFLLALQLDMLEKFCRHTFL